MQKTVTTIESSGRRKEASVRTPDFMIIGGMKCATTSVYRYLRLHPEVFMCNPKEPDFFARSRSETDLRKYLKNFITRKRVAGEASTTYTRAPLIRNVPERIYRHAPGVRLIYMVRHPLQRLFSHYRHNVARGLESRPPSQALRQHPSSTYIQTSRYAYQLDRYLSFFPLSRILIIKSEDLRTRKHEMLQRIFRFLGVDESFTHPDFDKEFNKNFAVSGKPLALPPSVYFPLNQVFRDDLTRLSRRTGLDFSSWKL